ncbi:hypothetical protein F9K33_06900 [bacterium]|nr:MAG: hypothetical protein F9K33_06900 [bacterium]
MKKTSLQKKETAANEKPEESLRWVDRGWYLVVEFELVHSPKLDAALELAQKNAYYAELVDERGVTFYRAIYFKTDFPKFLEIYDIVGMWKNTKLNFKGDDIAKNDFEIWYTSYKQYWGHRKTLNSADYCGVNKMSHYPDFLGCYDRCIEFRWRDPLFTHYQFSSKVWYSFGKRVGHVYVLDKQAILNHLNKVNKEYHACPCYGHSLIDLYVNKLPKEMDPVLHKEWQFKEDYLKLSANKSFFNYDIALSTMTEICPVNEKAYYKFMDRIFSS